MIADVVSGILAGLFGAMGFGGGSILILYLTLFKDVPQLKAQGINLIFFIPSAILALILHSKNKLIEWKLAIKYILISIPGLLTGYLLVVNFNQLYFRKIFAAVLIIIGTKDLLSGFKKSD